MTKYRKYVAMMFDDKNDVSDAVMACIFDVLINCGLICHQLDESALFTPNFDLLRHALPDAARYLQSLSSKCHR